MVNASGDWRGALALAAPLLAVASPAGAIPPYPPSQQGSKVSTYHCGRNMLTFTEEWNYAHSRDRKFTILIDDRALPKADAAMVEQQIAANGPFQTNRLNCTMGGFELILVREGYALAQLHLTFRGPRLSQVGFSDETTGYRMITPPPIR